MATEQLTDLFGLKTDGSQWGEDGSGCSPLSRNQVDLHVNADMTMCTQINMSAASLVTRLQTAQIVCLFITY